MGDGGGGGWGGVGGGEDSFSLVFENSIVLIKCTLYDTVFQRQVSICLVLYFLTPLVYTVQHIMVFGAVEGPMPVFLRHTGI